MYSEFFSNFYVMSKLTVSIIESAYLIYMFHFYKTSVHFNWNILPNFKNGIFKHLNGNEYGLRICPFGRQAIFALILLLLIRNFYSISKKLIFAAFVISFILSLMNLNAVVYLIPVWLTEIWLNTK